jgi:DNA-binding NarL/FixJ family response regulator
MAKGSSRIMQVQQVILANESRLLREMLHRVIEKAPDLDVAGQTTDLTALPSLIEQTNAHWVIVPLLPDDAVPSEVESLLVQDPSVRVLAVAVDGSRLVAKWMESNEKQLDDISLQELLTILRDNGAAGSWTL